MSPARPRLAAVSLAALSLATLAACGKAEPIAGTATSCAIVPIPLTGPGQSGVTCPDGSTLRFQGGTPPSFGATFTSTYCVRCHGTNVPQGAGPGTRNGAPTHANFDDICSIREHILLIDQRAGPVAIGQSTRMPPPALSVGFPEPTDAERAQLSEWVSCGAP
jgi:hypothetical protein